MPKSIFVLMFISLNFSAQAQKWELGFGGGTSHYFGDLNMYNGMRYPSANTTLYIKYLFNDYMSLRFSGHAGHIRYNDTKSINSYYEARNLSFNSLIFETNAAFEFNFFRYRILSKHDFFTPYAVLGAGFFNYNPQVKLNGNSVNLVDIGTEGQGNPDVTGNNKYSLTHFAIPVGMGVKYWILDRWSIAAEMVYRVTTTDYLDDVHSVYIDPFILEDGYNSSPLSAELADRSDELGIVPIGIAGKQRGDSRSNDGYMFINILFSYNFKQNRCPKQ